MSDEVKTEGSTNTDAGVDDVRDKVVKAIKSVYDPEIPVDVYELGLIYEVNIYPINNVYVLIIIILSY